MNTKICLLIAAVAMAVFAADGMKIHIFDVGQGMSTLVVYPSGYSVLIDAGETNWNSKNVATALATKLENVLGTKTIDVLVISHLHLDHIGYAGYGGLYYLAETYGFTFKKVIDRDHGKWTDSNGDGSCTEDEITWNNIGQFSGTAVKWVCYVYDKSKSIYKVRETAQLCSDTQISPSDDGAKVRIVTADALGCKDHAGNPVYGDHSTEDAPPSENDYSLGLIFQYKDFSFGHFGDLDGEYSSSSYGYWYNDIESCVLHRLGEVDVYNVNHHGSSHSSNSDFVKKLNPTVSVISCGDGNSYGHPTQAALNRLLDVSDVFVTETCNTDASYGSSHRNMGDVTITVSSDGKSYTVTGSNGSSKYSYDSKGASLPTCTN